MSGVPPPPPPAVKYAPKKLPPKIIPAGATSSSGNGVLSPPPPAPVHHHNQHSSSDLKERNSSVATGIIPSSVDTDGQQSPITNDHAPFGGTRQQRAPSPPPPPSNSNTNTVAAGEHRDRYAAVGDDTRGWEREEDFTRSGKRQLSSHEVVAYNLENDESQHRHGLGAQKGGGGIVLPPSSRVASPSRHGHDGSPLHVPPPPHAVASAIRARDDRGKSEDLMTTTATGGVFGTLNGATSSFPSSELVSAASFNALQHANKEQTAHIRELERMVANLTRDNNKLHERIAFLVDCGLSPDLANHDAFRLSSFGKFANMAAEGRDNGIGIGAAHEGKEGSTFVLPEEVTFLKTRIRRLEAALQLEMKAREQLDLKCIAQQTALTQILARHEDEREALQRELYNAHSSTTAAASSRLGKERGMGRDCDDRRAGRYQY